MTQKMVHTGPLLKLAIPLILSGFVSAAISFFGTVFLAHLGHKELAAGALVMWLFATLMSIVWGTMTSVSTLISQKHGENDAQSVSLVLRDGLLLAIIFIFPAALILLNLGSILLFVGQKPMTVALSMQYIHGLIWSLPADFIGLVLMQFIIGLGHSRTNLAFTLLLVPANLISSYALMFGKFGMPALGIAGLGWGTTIAFWITTSSIILYLYCSKHYQQYVRGVWRLDHFHFLKELFSIGIPMGVMFCIEVAYFTTLTLFMGHIDSQALAANQIALQYLGQLSVVTFSIAQAVTVRMSHSLGAKEVQLAKHACYRGIWIAAIFMTAVALVYWIFPLQLISIDFNIHDVKNTELIALTKQFLEVSALFQLMEAIRLTLFGALRSLKDTRFTLYISVLSFWGIALPIGYWLATPMQWGGTGFWWGAVIGASASTLLLVWRFQYKISVISR